MVSYGGIGRKRSYTVEFTVDETAARMFRRVFVVHDHILPPWWVKTSVVTASYSAVLGPYFATKRPF